MCRAFASMNRVLASLMCAIALNQAAPAQQGGQVEVNIDIDIDIERAQQIVIPQSHGGFVVDHRIAPHHPHPHPHPIPMPPPPPRPQPPSFGGQPIQIDSVEARVKIVEQTASTTLEIRLRNPVAQQTEAILLLPVPDDAVVSAFDFEGQASEPTARILRKDEARRLYDSIVAKVRDPALLEFAGYNLIRSSVFPVAAGGTQKVRLTYDHILPADGSRVDYVLPRSESLERRSPWRISLEIAAGRPISTVYSPSHEIHTERHGPDRVTVSLTEGSNMGPGPFLMSYLLEAAGNGGGGGAGAAAGVTASLLAYPDPKVNPQGGYFLLMAGLPASVAERPNPVKREVTIVIDRSGSMAGEKMEQARAAAIQVLEGLADGEHFNIIDYSTAVSAFDQQPVAVNDQTRKTAREYIRSIRPNGGTNIHDALVEALRPKPTEGMLPIVLFLTDGLPTVGQTSEVSIRTVAEKGNTHGRRIFAFGVGHDVNVPLLDRIADLTRATATYVLPEEDVEVKVAQVFKRLYGPVLANIGLQTLDKAGQPSTRLVRELIPAKVPDLFEGDQLILLGQYNDDEPVRFKLSGDYFGQERTFEFEFDLSKATTRHAFVPRLWASRRIAYLVDQIRQAGAESGGRPAEIGAAIFNDPRFRELTDEILRLSIEFGILTEYTAFLATEGTNLNDWNALRLGCGTTLNDRAVRTRSGKEAVNQGMNFNGQKMQYRLNYDNRYIDQNLQSVEISGVQQVNDRAFFKRGNCWIDGRLINAAGYAVQTVEGAPEPTPDQTIVYGSPEHLDLLHALAAQNRQGVLALAGDIVVQHEGKNILVRNDSQERSE